MPATPQCIASCTHDFSGGARLYSYSAEPDDKLHGGEVLAIKTFGFPVKSPVTPYISTWRSELGSRMNADTQPRKVILGASFSLDPWNPPQDLVTHAEQRMRRDELIWAAAWNLESETPVLERFSVEIRCDGGRSHLRCMNGPRFAPDLDVTWGALHLPSHGADNVQFNLRASLRERYNENEELRDRRVEVSLTGTAMPIPGWINY